MTKNNTYAAAEEQIRPLFAVGLTDELFTQLTAGGPITSLEVMLILDFRLTAKNYADGKYNNLDGPMQDLYSPAMSDHEMLVDIHAKMREAPTKLDLLRIAQRLEKTFKRELSSDEPKNGPINGTRQRQLDDVRSVLQRAYKENRQITLHAACLEAWQPLKNGYPTPKALYEFCHANSSLF